MYNIFTVQISDGLKDLSKKHSCLWLIEPTIGATSYVLMKRIATAIFHNQIDLNQSI
jgi:hypothetical protein